MRPPQDIQASYGERVKLRARRQAQYRALRDRPCVTKDGQKVSLMINAGLTIDLPHIEDTGAAGIGLFRTELQFMHRRRRRHRGGGGFRQDRPDYSGGHQQGAAPQSAQDEGGSDEPRQPE